MATTKTMGEQLALTQHRALEVIEEHGSEERTNNVKLLGGAGHTNDQLRRDVVQAELITGLAEIVQEQSKAIATLQEKIEEQESGKSKKRGS